jgi:hypothetical protein
MIAQNTQYWKTLCFINLFLNTFFVHPPSRLSLPAPPPSAQSLTPTMYRQMSGRAGRRGYDDVGNVIFFGVRAERAAQLMTTKLPSLQGQVGSDVLCAWACRSGLGMIRTQ